MQIQLERDRCERKGIPFDESKALENIKQKEKRPPLEEIKHGIKTVKRSTLRIDSQVFARLA